jgi:hypothetical protein
MMPPLWQCRIMPNALKKHKPDEMAHSKECLQHKFKIFVEYAILHIQFLPVSVAFL